MRSVFLGCALLAFTASAAASADISLGPYPNTVKTNGGAHTWYVGDLKVTGRKWGEMDAICRTVPIPQIRGWRAPTEAEVRTLFFEMPKQNAVARWTELHLPMQTVLSPAVPPYAFGARLHPQVNILTRDLFTYDGAPTTLAQVQRGKMYHIRWYNRWTQPYFAMDRSILYDPASRTLGSADRLLCVAAS